MKKIDNAIAQVPPTVRLHGSVLPVVAAVFIPAEGHMLPCHVVLYFNGKGAYNVHYLVHDPDKDDRYSTLHQGSYDLSYSDAVEEMNRRVGLNLRNRKV